MISQPIEMRSDDKMNACIRPAVRNRPLENDDSTRSTVLSLSYAAKNIVSLRDMVAVSCARIARDPAPRTHWTE